MPLLRVLAFAAALAIVVVMAVRAVQDVDLGEVTAWPLAVAFPFAVAWWVLLARGWALLVAGRTKRRDLSTWCRTQSIRYLPGGFWTPASRVALLPGTLFDKLSTVGAENVIALCAALAVGGAAFAVDGSFVWLPIVLALGVPFFVAPLVAGRSRVTRARVLPVAANDTVAFLAYVTAAVLVQAAVSGQWSPFAVAGAAALAWAAGLVVVIAPSGIGVREVVYVALLSGTFSEGEAAAAAVALRLLIVLAELAVLVLLGRPTADEEPEEAQARS
jgi:glycosyltransferase 2 family protein